MEVEIISRGSIKPCSSTPSHLKIYKLSLLDQFIPPIFYSTALFYPNSNKDLTVSQRSRLLKHSLSKTLSHFYPLAGKIKDYLSIDCNDEGAYYVKATTNISLFEFLTKPDHTSLNKFVPDASRSIVNPIGAYVIMIQETTFSCGGLALGFSVSHMVLDGTSFASFIKAWASSASGNKIPYPNLDSSSVFPQFEAFPNDAICSSLWTPFARKGKLAVRRLMFDQSSIDRLKVKASTSVKSPTRVEVVTSIITKRVKAALNVKSVAISHSVNIRRKATTPDYSLGNIVLMVHAFFTDDKESEIRILRNAIRKVDNDFVKIKAIEGGFSELYQEHKEMSSRLSINEMELISFTSWCNFGLYNDSDFGWGKPVWISHNSLFEGEVMPFYNMCILNDTRSGNGVEAWLYSSQDVADFIGKDDELLQYASINPSPLSSC